MGGLRPNQAPLWLRPWTRLFFAGPMTGKQCADKTSHFSASSDLPMKASIDLAIWADKAVRLEYRG